MKKIFQIFSIILLFIFWINNSFAQIEDNQIIDALNKQENSKISWNFKLQTFSSCEDFEKVMEKYIKTYWKFNKKRYITPLYRWWVDFGVNMVLEDSPMKKSLSPVEAKSISNSNENYSKTNTQVEGVDESEIVKTDWKYIYYYNSKQKSVYIVEAKNKLNIVKKIKIPKNFNRPVLYLWKNKLIIISWGYSNYFKRRYWVDFNNKTYVVIFNTSDLNNLKLEKLYSVNWRLSKSRKIGKYLYIISTSSFDIPFYSFKKIEDITLPRKWLIPNKIEVKLTNDNSKQNLVLKWKKFPYNIKASKVAKCNQIEYSLPTEDTLKKYNFSPSYNIISIIDTQDFSKEVKTKVVVWNTNEIYMSLKNLYITDRVYQNNRVDCPAFARCIMPYFEAWENSLIHKLNIKWDNLKYQTSAIIPWNPLTQYSMDEKWDNFRIITQKYYPKKETWVYVLDKDLKLFWQLNWLWQKENFKSSRFMWDKLFLVTFKNIDPFYVIDLKDEKNPKVIWELKIPGYSEYLHPYDENHIIWLGHDTFTNKYWGTRNWWLKLDLYEINYDKKVWVSSDCNKYSFDECPSYCVKNKCWSACSAEAENCISVCTPKCEAVESDKKDLIEVKQLYSLVMWDSGSRSEATYNPRMFIFNKAKKTLLLPVEIYKKESKESYKTIDFFQGLYSIKIDKDSWIKLLWKISHIDYSGLEEKRRKECKKYFNQKEEKQKCRILLDGSKYCPPKNIYTYIPEYCFKDSSIWTYIASKKWDFMDYFIKRALYIWDNIYSISNKKILENNMENFKKVSEVEMK